MKGMNPSVEVNGSLVPINRCLWLWVEPSGCILGSTLAEYNATADDAHREFVPGKRDRMFQLRWGFTMELIHRNQFEERALSCFMGKCGHELTIRVCDRCGRLGKNNFRTVIENNAKLTECAGKIACRDRQTRKYGRRSLRPIP